MSKMVTSQLKGIALVFCGKHFIDSVTSLREQFINFDVR